MSTEAWILLTIALVVVGPWAFTLLVIIATILIGAVWWVWESCYRLLKEMFEVARGKREV